MRASVQFELQISYAEPVRAVNQVLRLTPRSFDCQEVKDWRVEVLPDARLRRCDDSFGNILHSCTHDGPLDQLTVTAEGLIETYDLAGVARGLPEKLPRDVYLRHSDATEADAAVVDFARETLAGESDPLSRLHALMDDLHKAVAFTPAPSDQPRPAKEVFGSRAGSAREIAQLFIAVARSQSIPARFVSGFFLGGEEVDGAGAQHAWAEAYCEPIGWVAFDAALGYCPRDAHLRIAQGLDFLGAAPRRASRLGYASEEVCAILTVKAAHQASWQVQQ